MKKLVLSLLLSANALWAATDVLDTKFVKAYLNFPINPNQNTEGVWIDVVKEGNSRRELVERLYLSDAKLAGVLKWKLSKLNELTVVMQTGEGDSKKEHTLIKTKMKNGWFPSTELCTGIGVTEICEYRLERDSEKKTLSLKVVLK